MLFRSLSQPLAMTLLTDPSEFLGTAGLHRARPQAEQGLISLQPQPAGAEEKGVASGAHQLADGGERKLFRLRARRKVAHQQVPGGGPIPSRGGGLDQGLGREMPRGHGGIQRGPLGWIGAGGQKIQLPLRQSEGFGWSRWAQLGPRPMECGNHGDQGGLAVEVSAGNPHQVANLETEGRGGGTRPARQAFSLPG